MPDTRTLLTLFIIIIITIVIVIVAVKTIDPMSNLHWFRDLILIIATGLTTSVQNSFSIYYIIRPRITLVRVIKTNSTWPNVSTSILLIF